MLRLKESVVQRILDAIGRGDCATVNEIAEEISRLYTSIDGVFDVAGPFYDSIDLPRELVPNAYKCIGGEIEVTVEVYTPFDTSELCEDASPDWLGELDMVTEPLKPEEAVEFLEKVLNAKSINWIPSGLASEGRLSTDRLDEVFDTENETGYIVRRWHGNHQLFLSAKYTGRIEKHNAVLTLHSYLQEGTGVASPDSVRGLAARLWEEYHVPVRVSLVFKADCG